MANEQIENNPRHLLEANISSRLKIISFSEAGLHSATFFLLREDLAEWENPPVDFSHIINTQETNEIKPVDFLKVSLEEAKETRRHPAWKGLTIHLLPTTEYPTHSPHLRVGLHEGEIPSLYYVHGKPLKAHTITVARFKIGGLSLLKRSLLVTDSHFETIRNFEDSDYISLNRIVDKLRGPLPK